MEHTLRIRALGLAIVLALGIATSIITSTVVATRAYQGRAEQAAKTQQEMTVKGSARTRVRSDLAVWHIRVAGDGADLKLAYAALEFGVDRVQVFLHAQNFADAEISLSAIDTDTHFLRDKDGKETRQVTGYTLDRTFTITTGQIDRVSDAASEVTQLLREGVWVVSRSPEFMYTKIADMKVQILGEASRDALTRAKEIAANSGCTVGDVRRAQMGVIQITRPNSTDVSGYGIYDTSTIEKDISVVVTTTFGIEAK